MKHYFTADTAQKLFKERTGYEFNTTVPGQLLARVGAKKIGFKKDGRAAYDAHHWEALWKSMLDLADKRHSFGQGPEPVICNAPELPQETEVLLKTKPFIDFTKKGADKE